MSAVEGLSKVTPTQCESRTCIRQAEGEEVMFLEGGFEFKSPTLCVNVLTTH